MASSPIDYKSLNFALYKYDYLTDGANINTMSYTSPPSLITESEISDRMTSNENIELIASLIISRNSIGIDINRSMVIENVSKMMKSWVSLNKFKTEYTSTSIQSMITHFNREFVNEFADIIVPVESIKVHTIMNPNGMYVQQSRDLVFKNKGAKSRERSLYKHLVDKVRDDPIDETESMFYKYEQTNKRYQSERNAMES